ncbi:MAG TPA: hypothetical protein VK986_05765 [Tepidisphaeraceae bacterium]|nr:hypothetical protein [Tepidisphaeraceae bacterium]
MTRLFAILAITLVAGLLIATFWQNHDLQQKFERGDVRACAANLKQLALAIERHASANGGAFPADWTALFERDEDELSIRNFCCIRQHQGSESGRPRADVLTDVRAGKYPTYGYLGASLSATSPGDAIVVYEPADHLNQTGGNALLKDKSVVWLTAAEIAGVERLAQTARHTGVRLSDVRPTDARK